MEDVSLESANQSEAYLDGNEAGRGTVTRNGAAGMDPAVFTRFANGAGKEALYQAVIALSRSIAGRTDLRSLLSGAAEALRPIVAFDHLSLVLHDRNGNAMQRHILNEPCNPVLTSSRLPVEADPAGWVWLNQQPLILARLQSETRWPEFVARARGIGVTTVVLVPLTTGDRRLGAFGLGFVAEFAPDPEEIAFLGRIASEFAVAVEGFLAKQEALRERDRLRTLFEITNALVSNLDRDELFSAISVQLSKIIRHDCAVLTLRNQDGCLEVYALHAASPSLWTRLKDRSTPWACRPRRGSPHENRSWHTTPTAAGILIRAFSAWLNLGSNPFARCH